MIWNLQHVDLADWFHEERNLCPAQYHEAWVSEEEVKCTFELRDDACVWFRQGSRRSFEKSA